ncbi:hypothetical protein EHS25_006088 [Saitozyma podzolica]|uniref:Uncharacterized protein n=1 Tax=Saitozyma podzolica TaxID=1890683 RepID=A0A427XTM5_9TREE|nr:hypothetical protein EHS25_006088 [Saitozyma podzolica]
MATQNPPAWATAEYPQAQTYPQPPQVYYPQPVAGGPMAPQQAYMVQPPSMPGPGQAPIAAQQPYTMQSSLPYDTKVLQPQPGVPAYQMAAYPGAAAMYPLQAAPPPSASEGPPASSLSKESGSVLCPACHQKSVTNTTSISGSNTH